MSKLRKQQISIEQAYSKNTARDIILSDIISSGCDAQFQTCWDRVNKYLNGKYYASKEKRLKELRYKEDTIITAVFVAIAGIDIPTPIQVISTKIAVYLDCDNLLEGVKTASEILGVLHGSMAVRLIPAKDSETGSILVLPTYQLSNESVYKLDKLRYLPPMVCEPREIRDNTMSGYFTKNESIILGKGNNHSNYIALDAINLANKVCMSLDTEVLKEVELPKRDTADVQQFKNFIDHAIGSREIYNLIVNKGNKFWFSWRYDKRGRMYSSGYEINIQGSEYKKALINLHRKRVLCKYRRTSGVNHFSDLEYIKIDLANQYGLDKCTFEDRIKWVDYEYNNLDSMDRDADKPILFRKALRALKDCEQGKATGFIMGLDATASGKLMPL